MLLQSRSVIHVNPNPPVNGLLPVGLAGMRLVAVPGGDTAVSISELSQETTLAASVEVSQDVPVEPPVQGGSRGRRRKSA
jgi:hypothetical protein